MEVRFEQLTKRYGDKLVLDVDKGTLASGEITGIIGPNGAGKTTLLNILAGLDESDTGKVLYQQMLEAKPGNEAAAGGFSDFDEASERGSSTGDSAYAHKAKVTFTEKIPAQEVTMLFQTPYMLHTTVEKNVAYPLRLRRISSETIKRRVDNLLAELDLSELAKDKAWRLSGGETQKLALARAIALRPKLLLLDEPTSNIDNIHVAVIEKVLASEQRKHQTTIAIISHNLAQIRRICSQAIFMDKGKIVEYGPTKQVLLNPEDSRTQAFVAGELLL